MAETACARCKKTAAQVPNMKHCAKCTTTPYCSRECQKADWKAHKKICAQQAASSSAGFDKAKIDHSTTYTSPRLKGLEMHVPNPFTRIDRGTYLHDRPEKDVYKLLIDAFRMRQADEVKMLGMITPESVYTGAASSIVPFRAFLSRMEQSRGFMPKWWNAEKRKECEEFGESGGDWSNLKAVVTKDEMIKQYGDERMPMQLRMFAEEALQDVSPGALPGAGKQMRGMMMIMEGGGTGDGRVHSLYNINNLMRP